MANALRAGKLNFAHTERNDHEKVLCNSWDCSLGQLLVGTGGGKNWHRYRQFGQDNWALDGAVCPRMIQNKALGDWRLRWSTN